MVALTWTVIGLVLEILGVLTLASGETRHHFATLRYWANAEGGERWLNSDVAKQPWWARPLIRIGVRLGSRNVEDMGQDDPLETTAIKLAGYGMIFFGFILQTLGTIASRFGC